jgi:hypothetical protein
MDIAYYISDLLGQQGELSVPNLGYFVQMRMPAHYDEAAKQFFPPHISVQFDPQVIDDDDSLAAYITSLKKISLASAKYFIEKYIANLKSQVIIEDVPFANLGVFRSDGINLTFKPNTQTDHPAFFAFPPVDAYRVGEEAPVKETIATHEPSIGPEALPEPAPPLGEPVIEPATEPGMAYVPEQPAAPEPEFSFAHTPAPVDVLPLNNEEELIYEDEPRRAIGPWTIVLIVITILAIAFGALYKFKPELFKDWFSLHKNPYTASQPITPQAGEHTDSLQKDTAAPPAAATPVNAAPVKKDSVANKIKLKKDSVKAASKAPAPVKKTPAAPAVIAPSAGTIHANAASSASADLPEVSKGSWVIYGGAFPIRSSADKAVSNYKSLGYEQARLLSTNVKKGNNYKVILGAYKTRAEATDASKEMQMTHKITVSIEQLK